MISFLVLATATLVSFIVMRSLLDNNRKLPPASTHEGKRARAIAGLVLIMLIGAFIFSTVNYGSARLTIQSIVIAIIVVLIPLLARWKMDKNDK